jgi:hypothetical protein
MERISYHNLLRAYVASVKENLHEQIVFEEKLGVWLEIRATSAGYIIGTGGKSHVACEGHECAEPALAKEECCQEN